MRLALQQGDVVAVRAAGRNIARQFFGNEHDGGEWSAELVRGGGGEAVERMQLLLVRQHQFARVEGCGHLPALPGKPASIDGEERQA